MNIQSKRGKVILVLVGLEGYSIAPVQGSGWPIKEKSTAGHSPKTFIHQHVALVIPTVAFHGNELDYEYIESGHCRSTPMIIPRRPWISSIPKNSAIIATVLHSPRRAEDRCIQSPGLLYLAERKALRALPSRWRHSDSEHPTRFANAG